MKYYLSLLSLTFYSVVSAQLPYTPFPEDGAVWHVAYTEPNEVGVMHYQYSYEGDTTINNLFYHKLSLKIECICFGESVSDEGIVGFIRQDSVDKKVYYYPKNGIQEYVLYDFDLELGDTYPETYTNQAVDPGVTVVAIDSMLTGNGFRRVFVFGGTFDSLKLIEGIGATTGLLSPVITCFESCWWLSCFQVNSEPQYSSQNIYANVNMCIPVGIENRPQQASSISLSANLVARGEAVTVTNNSGRRMVISVFDLQGRKNLEIDEASYNGDITTAALSKGIYIVNIRTNQSLFIAKLFIQ